MLARLIVLWPGGPSLTLGSYLIGFKCVFSLLFIAWAIGLARWPRRAWLLGGSLGLAAFAWLALDFPLERPYAVDDGLPGLFELAQPMVTASRGGSGEGWMVGQENPRSFWSFLLAALAGFEPERLFWLYRALPLVCLLVLALALTWGLGSLGGSEQKEVRLAPSLAVFFVLFLGSHPLSVQDSAGPLWPRLFWLEPRIALALAVAALHLRTLALSRQARQGVLAAASLAIVFGLEPRLGAFLFLGGCVWLALLSERPGSRWVPAGSLALGAAIGLALGSSAWLAPLGTSNAAGGEIAVRQWLSLTRHGGPVFWLGLLGLFRLGRSADRPERLLAAWVGSAALLWIAGSSSARAASLVDFRLMDTLLRVLLPAVAGIEAHRLLLALKTKAETAPGTLASFPQGVRGRPYALGLALLVALALPASFPYWWQPVRFDMAYVRSLAPISRQALALGDWIRAEVPRDAVFVAGQSYAPWIPALSGRQVLLVGGGPAPRDVAARRRAESWFVESQDPARIRAAAGEWRITHLAWGRLDAESDVSADHRFFDGSPLFRKVWQRGRWVRVYELLPAAKVAGSAGLR
jgi:hypothetical protein